ncbi:MULTISPECIES: bile acid:sodium symporter family protein [Amycolatopsis]|uniref:Bile acid:Na+ symporter, BASS family n=2 Tax=Amycolatopsis TaxID=1813 RepID=A0A1I3WKF4_9PSEU|nr:bile acid:sodium symporter family protein [Amycolatopsis sacchari]SFK06936.1 bile acid:Na+ symporter, BASS family [Amycolatopsis sacchari]
MTPRRLTASSQILLLLGFLVPFVVSGFRGMPMGASPVALAASVVLWVAGLVVGYRAFQARRPAAERGWRGVCAYVAGTSATWLMLGIGVGFVYHPTVSHTFVGTHFSSILAITLVVMGVQIMGREWLGVARNLRAVSVVVVLRWLVMPLVGYCVSFVAFRLLLPAHLADDLAIGMILLCTSPTGAASNSLTLIARGDLALSVSATTVNVLLAPFLQPLLVKLFVGSSTSVDAHGMFVDLATTVLVPVVVASIFGTLFPRVVEAVKPVLGPLAVLSLACVLTGTVSKGTATMLNNLYVLGYVAAACVVQGLAGLSLGYFIPKYLRFTTEQRIASCFEVGVENAAIAPALAASYFGPLAIVPAVVYGKTQNLLAVMVFARRFQRRDQPGREAPTQRVPDSAVAD